MSASIIDGKQIALNLREGEVKQRVIKLKQDYGITTGLAVIIAGDNPASKIYVSSKAKACESVGMKSFTYSLPASVTENQLAELIQTLNEDKNVHGILVQLPLPEGLDESYILSLIDYKKDVDGFHDINSGKLLRGDKKALLPCTPAGCIDLIKSICPDLNGKNAVVVGRSNIVGKPLALLLLEENATVTVCHSRTKNLKEVCLSADILCCAVGRANFIKGDMIKQGAIVIDVGINRVDGKVVGDVDYLNSLEVAGAITPVPGGVGPMTIAMLLKNTVTAAERLCKISR